MKPILYFFFIFSFIGMCYAEPRGTTNELLPNGIGIEGKCKVCEPVHQQPKPDVASTPDRTEWSVVDSLHVNRLFSPYDIVGYHYNATTHGAELVTNLLPLTPEAQAAIQKSPTWIQADLENTLRKLSTEKQLIWSTIINNAQDPVIDEIAFCVAHTSTAYLSAECASPQLFVDNANLLYAIDNELDYVQIVNHGSSATQADYYSTTKYKRRTSTGSIEEVEVPRDIYYWYLVHPKLTDEIPDYIDPDIVENNSNHTNNIVTSPTGKFWRQFFFYEADEGHMLFKTMLDTCVTVWNHDGSTNDAIHAIQTWINSVMSFTSNAERPHQPVRIYRKGFGRCGEYADFTSAACRTALIPCTSILSMSCDHTWNEFWEGEWTQWEPVNGYINVPLTYEDGWGKVFGSVFEIRSDGYLTPVTARYSSGVSHLTITVKDSTGTPIDGARVLLAIDDAGTIRSDMVSFSNNEGVCNFEVGENRHYYLRVETSIGNNPTANSTYMSIVDNAISGQLYSYEVDIANQIYPAAIDAVEPPTDAVDDYRMSIVFNSAYYELTGVVTWDDISVLGPKATFNKQVDQSGSVSAFYSTPEGYDYCANFLYPFTAFNSVANQSSGSTSFNIPAENDYYGWLYNGNHINNLQYVEGSILYLHNSTGINDEVEGVKSIKLYQNTPNPFNPTTEIEFNLPSISAVSLAIYNCKGEKVRTLINESLSAGNHKILWDGTDTNKQALSTGMYFYQFKDNHGSTITKKMLLLK